MFEFKNAKSEDELETKSMVALNQIQSKNYKTEILKYSNVEIVIEIGLAYFKKKVLAATRTYYLKTDKTDNVIFIPSEENSQNYKKIRI